LHTQGFKVSLRCGQGQTKINLPLGVATNISACIMNSYLKKRGMDMTYTPSYRVPKFDQHVVAYKREIAYLANQIKANYLEPDVADLYYWALIARVGFQEANLITLELA
jgi:hypothetical protein